MRWVFVGLVMSFLNVCGQGSIQGVVKDSLGTPLDYVTVAISELNKVSLTNDNGEYKFEGIPEGHYHVKVYYLGYLPFSQRIHVKSTETKQLNIQLISTATTHTEVVITGTMKEVSKDDSPVPVEVYTPKFFQKNPTPNLFESLQNVNGVRPQLNCSVCNTGDIHINGLEGPYTMIMIDGMPIVSGLSTVYGLTGIPNSLIEQVEIVKGPASSLYGSEAIGGVINVITKNPWKAPKLSADVMMSDWGELNTDVGYSTSIKEKVHILTGVNAFWYDNPIDNNGDGFTDVTLSKKISLFNKVDFTRKESRKANFAVRLFTENRWGGQMNWSPEFRGGDRIYGESIYTNRAELMGAYQLPTKEHLTFSYSLNTHQQDSYYGTLPYLASQNIGFGQLVWRKSYKRNDVLVGLTYRLTYYDDNSVATEVVENNKKVNKPDLTNLPGIFIQDEIKLSEKNQLLIGQRFDYNSRHGSIYTPRIAWKFSPDKLHILRLNMGTGYRVVNLFTEDHASLTGARKVIVSENLNPEKSYNANLNYIHKVLVNRSFIGFDVSAWYTHFTNKITADYDTDPNLIIYDNIDGYGVSKGISLNIDLAFGFPLKILAGATVMDVSNFERNGTEHLERIPQILAETYNGVWSVSYEVKKWGLTADYTGNIYGPMRLPLLGPLDDRPEWSPIWSLQNIQLTKKVKSRLEIYGGIKNLLNYTPPRNSIARSFDPFDKKVITDTNGNVVPTTDNPNALTFDPSYVFAPNQGIRFFGGIRYNIQKK